MTNENTLANAIADKRLMPTAAANLQAWQNGMSLPDWASESVAELIREGAWDELNDRFFRDLEFGTGGMRSRTVGGVLTRAERGVSRAGETPAHASIGSNLLNDFTLIRATIGLFNYTHRFIQARGEKGPRLVIAHDVRHFSRHFCELAASTWCRLGGWAYIFDGPRSTPQLSFTVRHLRAHCGVVVTASHNPPHDNGYKVYFEDGGQVVSPHAEGIVAEVDQVRLSTLTGHLHKELSHVATIGDDVEEAYRRAAFSAIIEPAALLKSHPRVAFTSLHGTGGAVAVPLLQRAGVQVFEVESQRIGDPNFSTVASPNPENAAALSEVVALAEREQLDLALGTDPDGDRVGVAAPSRDGRFVLLTGNQVGALLADFRLRRLKEAGWIPEGGSPHVALIKTFVTSALQDAIARAHGVKVINTLTGFKWIGARLQRYESELRAALERTGETLDYDAMPNRERAQLLQQHSTFFAFGGEESYGYLPIDTVRDKDANAASLALVELVAHAKSSGRTLPELLDDLYLDHGYHLEGVAQITCEGAAGAARIARMLTSYRKNPPREIAGRKVNEFTDFGRTTIQDADGEEVPKQDLYFLDFVDGYRCAIRGSGTEPKLKFYLFAREAVPSREALERLKSEVHDRLDELGSAMVADANRRGDEAG